MADDAWLRRTAEAVALDWALELGEPFALSRYSYVAPAGDDAVLKIVDADDDESIHEAEALQLWAGDGAVRLLRADPARRALLLERATPGTDLSELDEAPATAAAVAVAERLWRPADAPFGSVHDRVPEWLAQAEPESAAGRRLLERATAVYAQITRRDDVLVHGDLHHHNILASGRGYVAIDPKPMLGEPEFDIGPFLWNPLGSVMTPARTERRLSAFAAAGLDPVRMRAWALIRGAYLDIGNAKGDSAVAVLEAMVAG